MTKQMLTTIPFAGFYETVHDHELDNQLEMMFQDRQTGTPNEKFQELAFDVINWADVQRLYAKDYCEAFADRFGIALEFESMDSPKFYNFTTDRIFAKIDVKEVKRLLSVVDRDVLDTVAAENFTSRDGFLSSYSNDVEDWGPVEKWDHNQVGTLVQAYVYQQAPNFNSLGELDLMESALGNGSFDDWVSKTSPGIERLWKIHSYLEDRKER